jgi:predicted nucleic acid-binding protein
MILPDTSVWIQFLRGNKKITSHLIPEIEKFHVYASSFVFGELLQGARRPDEKEVIMGYWKNLLHCNEEDIFIEAGNYSAEKKLFAQGVGLIDAAILFLVIKNDLKLWTLDKKLDRIIPAGHIYKPL